MIRSVVPQMLVDVDHSRQPSTIQKDIETSEEEEEEEPPVRSVLPHTLLNIEDNQQSATIQENMETSQEEERPSTPTYPFLPRKIDMETSQEEEEQPSVRSVMPQTLLNIEDNQQSATIQEKMETSQEEERPSIPSYPFLPRKIITVVGLESSGTTFTSDILSHALKVKRREGAFPYSSKKYQPSIEVQHVSFPQGRTCRSGTPPIVDAIMPSQCIVAPRPAGCYEIEKSIKGRKLPLVNDPGRFILNITSHKEFYESMGVQQYFVIVIRDTSISFKARLALHCNDPAVAKMEEDVSMSIINQALNKYILKGTGSAKAENSYRRLLSLNHAGLPSRNGIVLVSYETLVRIGKPYIQMLYNALDIESDYFQEVNDGNEKYVK